MTSVKITDAQVQRAKNAYENRLGHPSIILSAVCVREMLEAALTEPEEIPVSEGMTYSGRATLRQFTIYELGDSIKLRSSEFGEALPAVYRAMERVRREEQRGLQGAPCGASVPVNGTAYRIHTRSTDAPRSPGSIIRMHRREGDR